MHYKTVADNKSAGRCNVLRLEASAVDRRLDSARERRIFDVVVEHRRRRNALMAYACELAASVRAKRDRLNGRGLMADHRIHLRAGELQTHRPVQNLRGEDR